MQRLALRTDYPVVFGFSLTDLKNQQQPHPFLHESHQLP